MSVTRKELEKVLVRMEEDKEFNFVDFRAEQPLSASNEDQNIIPVFLDYIRRKDEHFFVMKWIIKDELKSAAKETLFRESSLGISLLTEFWFRESKQYLNTILSSTFKSVSSLDHSLEIDPLRASEDSNLKRNASELLSYGESLLVSIFSSLDIFPEIFKIILRGLDAFVSLKFPNVGLSLVGGVLFLRMINPALIFPEKYGLLQNGSLNEHGRRALVLLSKLLQTMANETQFDENKEKYMMITNRFIRKHQPAWKTFFHQLMTGRELIDANSGISMDIQPEDLINKSNQDIYHRVSCPLTLGKQREVITKLLAMEKQAMDGKSYHEGDMSVNVTRFKKTGKVLSKVSKEFPHSVEETFKILHKNKTKNIPSLKELKIVLEFNDNLRWVHCKLKLPFPFADRDVLSLTYAEILPEDQFAIFSSISVDDIPRAKVELPKEHGVVRAELMTGMLIRGGKDKNSCTITSLVHLDLKGNSQLIPTKILKKQLLRIQTEHLKDEIPDVEEEEEKIALRDRKKTGTFGKRTSSKLQNTPV